MTQADFALILPEAGLSLLAIVLLMIGAYGGKDAVARPILWVTVAGLTLTAAWVGMRDVTGTGFGQMLIIDTFSRFAKVTLLLSAAAVLAMSADYLDRRGLLRFEYPILMILAVIGMMIMVSAGNLICLYMSMELQSFALYILAAIRRDSARSSESGLKYFVLGSLSSGILVYGASLIYGFTGTANFDGILDVVRGGEISLGLLFGLVLLLIGMAFKVSAVPFHMWTPDVYEGSPTPVTAFFSTAPKVAAMALIGRVLFSAFGHVPGEWSQIIAALAVLSMFTGSIAAIGQRDIKRMMAYSSIAHMGFALIGLAAGDQNGVAAMLVYMAIYAVMNVGTFAFILSMERDGKPITEIASLSLFAQTKPITALVLLVMMFSLAGVPPMLGFFAKYGVMAAAVHAGMTWLAILGVIASVIGAYYYLRIVFLIYFGTKGQALESRTGAVQYVLMVGSAVVIVLGSISMLGVDNAAVAAAKSLVGPLGN